MPDIKTPDDWWKVAEATLPLLPQYALDHAVVWDGATANQLLEKRDWKELHVMLHELWDRLPDSPSIRYAPFFSLCDLCSEAWVFEEGDDSSVDEDPADLGGVDDFKEDLA